MKTKNLFILLLVSILIFEIIGTNTAYGVASFTISPSSGPVGTTISTQGTGYSPSGTITNTHNFQSTHSAGWKGFVNTEEFTGLPVGATISKFGLNINNSGSGNFETKDGQGTLTTNGTYAFVQVEKFTGLEPNGKIKYLEMKINNTGLGSFSATKNYQTLHSNGWNTAVSCTTIFTGLTPGAIINTVSLNVFSAAGNVRVKVYQDDGGGGNPGTLLGESGTLAVSGTGIQSFSVSATIPASGDVYACFETDSAALDLQYSSLANNRKYVLHTFGSGPNPFGAASSDNLAFWSKIDYTISNSHVRIKVYQDDGGGGNPGTLLGESGSYPIVSTGVSSFSVNATIPASGNVWAGFETDNAALTLYYLTGAAASEKAVAHTFGSGPNPFGVSIDGTNNFYEILGWSSQTAIRVKVYQDNNGTGGPSTLLGQSGEILVNGINLQNFTVSATIPASGNVFVGFETNSSLLNLKESNGVSYRYFVTHTFGSGPSPFGVPTKTDFSVQWSQITYNLSDKIVTINWDGSPLVTSPFTIITNTTGGFSATTFAPASLVGSHTLNASDGTVHDTKTFTITLPSVTSAIIGSTSYTTSSLTPTITYSSPPGSLTATQNQLSRNGSFTVTNAISNTVNPGGTTISSIGETMVGPSSYFVNTTLTDGANVFVVKSNTVVLTPGGSPPNNGTKCGINGCPAKHVVTYSAHRNPSFTKLHITALVTPIPFNAECNISNGTFSSTHRWYNFTGLAILNFNASVPQHDSAGYICYGSGVLFSGLSPGNQTVVQAGANVFNNSFGAIIGIPAGMFVVVLIGSLANQRTGPIYLIASLCVAGILATIGFFVLDTGWWAMSLIFGMLGLLVGRKVF